MYVKYFKIADIVVEVRSDLPFTKNTFHPKFKQFESNGPANEMAVIHHHFSGIPEIQIDMTQRIYFRPPWAIYKKDEKYIYEWIKAEEPYENYDKKAVVNEEHSHLDIYHDGDGKKKFESGALTSLAMFSTDQIWLSQLLSNRSGGIIHSLGVIIDGNGYLFVGHSDAGKSTMAKMLMNASVILCDDRNVTRKTEGGYRVYGTWSHGDVPDISPLSAPLKGIFFLEKSDVNKMILPKDNAEVFKILLACLIRPLTTTGWWDRSMDLLTDVLNTTPCRTLKFDKSGGILELLRQFDPASGTGNV